MKENCLAVLGSTGSIGRQTLEVARHLGYEVASLAAYGSLDALSQQIEEFHPKVVAVFDPEKAFQLQKKFPRLSVVAGIEGLEEAASVAEADLVVSAITGAVGIAPTLAAIDHGKKVALANKEVLVAAGDLVMERARAKGVPIIPVDSEHSALFQCLEHKKKEEVRRLILTASGGPFWRFSKEEKEWITPDQALKHPNWSMGPKITIDSSTLMNKGLEVIEAFHLFRIPLEQIEVVIHPQSIVHSMVEMCDGSMLAQMSEPSMIFPIQYALTWPHRRPGLLPPFPFAKHSKWEFFPVEKESFLCLDLAFESLKQGGSFPCYLNAANEILVARFLEKRISWADIGRKLEKLLSCHKRESPSTLEMIFAIDAQARREALAI